MILTDEELTEITGKRRYRSQRNVLSMLGINHLIRPDGKPIVSKAHFEEVLGISDKDKQFSRNLKPNWSALDAKTETKAK